MSPAKPHCVGLLAVFVAVSALMLLSSFVQTHPVAPAAIASSVLGTDYEHVAAVECRDAPTESVKGWATSPLSQEVLQAPLLLSPADGALMDNLTLTLEWGSVVGAADYLVRVDEFDTFGSDNMYSAIVAATNYTLTLIGGGTRFWCVVARDSSSSLGLSSEVRSFTIITITTTTTAITSTSATAESTTTTTAASTDMTAAPIPLFAFLIIGIAVAAIEVIVAVVLKQEK